MGLRPGDTLLDPMMGSGTALIEASLMGIKSVGFDVSPFCRFMTQAKLDALTLPLAPVREASKDPHTLYEFFKGAVGQAKPGSKTRARPIQDDFFRISEEAPPPYNGTSEVSLPRGFEREDVYNFVLLAYLDSVGYSERSDRKSPFDQFRAILERYLFVAAKIQHVLSGLEQELAGAKALEGDARKLDLADSSVHGILFSPPYSFAIDYHENDSFHLNHMGVDVPALRESMIGLRGSTLREKYEMYKTDMAAMLSECARVLRREGLCSIVVGTNNNQLSKILGVSPEEVEGIDQLMVSLAAPLGLRLVRKLSRRIAGIANTMRTEYIVMLQKA
jgi:hypothetical protein